MKPRGRDLELHIERVFAQLNALPGVLAIRIEVRQARVGDRLIYCKAQPFDYLIVSKRGVFAFDAKECSGKVWYPSHGAKPHQIEALEKVRVLGHRSAFVVHFKSADNPCRGLRMIEDLHAPATIESGCVFDWEMFI
jgi:penicillin-binding protein-related factor A (putative recombinase)